MVRRIREALPGRGENPDQASSMRRKGEVAAEQIPVCISDTLGVRTSQQLCCLLRELQRAMRHKGLTQEASNA